MKSSEKEQRQPSLAFLYLSLWTNQCVGLVWLYQWNSQSLNILYENERGGGRSRDRTMAPHSQIVSWIPLPSDVLWHWKMQDNNLQPPSIFSSKPGGRKTTGKDGWIASTFFIRSWCSPRGLSLLSPHPSDLRLNLYHLKSLLFLLPKAPSRLILCQPPVELPPLGNLLFYLCNELTWVRLFECHMTKPEFTIQDLLDLLRFS